jgi:uroporphyrinogen-III synthase
LRIWVTRTEGEATAARLRELGHAPLLAPVLEARALPGEIDLQGVHALANNNRNGVRMFAGRCGRRDLPAFVVGEGTAAAAREAGFAEIRSADGNVEALVLLIRQARPGVVLHPSALEPAQDLARMLALRGVQACSCAVYETAALPLHAAMMAALEADPAEIDAVLVHSPRGARQVAQLLAAQGGARDLEAFCISAAAAAPLRELNLRETHVAEFPNEASLLKLLEP